MLFTEHLLQPSMRGFGGFWLLPSQIRNQFSEAKAGCLGQRGVKLTTKGKGAKREQMETHLARNEGAENKINQSKEGSGEKRFHHLFSKGGSWLINRNLCCTAKIWPSWKGGNLVGSSLEC